ncbi:MAG: hypothetical protein HY744_16245 [Deltaproteobacteria bacterium]|nr:hypothetical protein [Deltaproteobacteria bacterium]
MSDFDNLDHFEHAFSDTLLAVAGCSSVCDDAEEACADCKHDESYCEAQTEICRLLIGPDEDNCCESLLESYQDGC